MVQASSSPSNTTSTLSIAQLLAANAGVTREASSYVECPVDPQHRMPRHRLQWHLLNRCKKAQALEGRLLHCPHDFSHVYLERAPFEVHVRACAAHYTAKQQAQTRQQQQWYDLCGATDQQQ